MSSPAGRSGISRNVDFPFPQVSALRCRHLLPGAPGDSGMAALSVEFVAKPEKARGAQAAVPATVNRALNEVAGFAGCLVMISDQEARLITVVTFWAGGDGAMRCSENARWVHTLLAPYIDRCLRVQTMVAHLPMLPALPSTTISPTAGSMIQEVTIEDENASVV